MQTGYFRKYNVSLFCMLLRNSYIFSTSYTSDKLHQNAKLHKRRCFTTSLNDVFPLKQLWFLSFQMVQCNCSPEFPQLFDSYIKHPVLGNSSIVDDTTHVILNMNIKIFASAPVTRQCKNEIFAIFLHLSIETPTTKLFTSPFHVSLC